MPFRTTLPAQLLRRAYELAKDRSQRRLEDLHRLAPPAPGEVDTSAPVRLILHVGVPKTGSTSIQMALVQAYRRLLAGGILYPMGIFGDRQHSLLARIVQRGSDADVANFFLSLRQLANRSRCATVILSGEHISILKKHELERLRSGIGAGNFDPLVIIFTRPIVSLYRSRIAQRMLSEREGFATPYSLFKAIENYSVDAISEAFSAIFGRQNVIRHSLNSGDDAVQLFAADAGISLPPVARRNVSTDFAVRSFINSIKADFYFSTGVIHAAYDAAFGKARHRFTSERRFTQEMLQHVDASARSALERELAGDHSKEWTREEQIRYLRRLEKFVRHLRRYHAWTKEGRREARDARRQRSLQRLGIGSGGRRGPPS